MSVESGKFNQGDTVTNTEPVGPSDPEQQWAENYWRFYQETHPEVTISIQEALQDPALASEAQSMYDRAKNTVDLTMAVLVKKVGAKVVDTPPLDTNQGGELRAA